MERSLKDRDRVGVQDFILLEDYTNIEAFVDNLKKRFKENLIYTTIGQVLISVNPYQQLPIYTENVIKDYRNASYLETPPHVYALADVAFKSLTEENRGQCILISGESGAGKTEASKKVLQFVAAATGHKGRVENVKDKLLKSNPVLEAFGNAKTNKNDNSSRFGKYMDIAFDYAGDPAGGHILNYLLEKSRVVHQSEGERNFHIFYQLLAVAEDERLRHLQLSKSENYYYLNHLGSSSSPVSDADGIQFLEVLSAMSTMELSDTEQQHMFTIIASILHLGNVTFKTDEGTVSIVDLDPVSRFSKLLGCDSRIFANALTHRTVEAKGDVVVTPLSEESAYYARDALAKAIYDRLFTWLVKRLNNSLAAPKNDTAVLGILDIYGFEVFTKNSFEQFCINLCNEKLQQLFVKLTLQQEQEEYEREGIEWVQIDYFNNKVIVDMIEEKHRGIIAMMDEECLRPGDPTDLTLLAKMNQNLNHHPHYFGHAKSDIKTQKIMGRDEFRLVHYAGEVTYCVNSFLDKNSDLLFRDLCEVMTKTTNTITMSLFSEEELQNKKRPETTMTKFQQSLSELMKILSNKEPSYIRCIRPNDNKSAAIFDVPTVRHQVKYLGLMENLRVRRAGFAYRRPYEDFLERYKSLCPATWPNFKGETKQGVQVLVNYLGYTPDEYRMGKTKLFIRSPTTLFKTEDAFQSKKHDIATIIQKIWKGRAQRLAYQKYREHVISTQKLVRGFLARRRLKRRKEAVLVIRRFIQGFMTRNGEETDMNRKFLGVAKSEWLKRLATQLPKHVLDKSWPKCPVVCEEASKKLRTMYMKQLAMTYQRKLSAQRKKQLENKILAESLFKGKKPTYQKSFPHWFQNDRVSAEHTDFVKNFIQSQINGEQVMYSTSVTKFDRHNYKSRPRVLLMTDKNVYLLDPKSGKTKHKLGFKSVTELVVTSLSDDFLLVRIAPDSKKDKGDLILSVPHLIEAVTTFVDITKFSNVLHFTALGELPHNMIKGKSGTIQVSSGLVPSVTKGKSGLVVQG